MDLEQTVKYLQAQNYQFQETLLALANGQQDMMALPAAKKKPKKKSLVNIGRSFKESVRQIPVVEDSSEEDEVWLVRLRVSRLTVLMIKRLVMMIISMSSIHPSMSSISR